MSNQGQTGWYHSNRYHAGAACEHCGGVVHHENWCITVAANVYYAYEVIADPSKLTIQDALILHSLGVAWMAPCTGNCRSNT